MKCEFDFLYHSIRPAKTGFNFHKHNCYELVYYISGNGKTSIGGEEYTFTQNTFSIIEPDTLHDEYREEESDIIFIGFNYAHDSIHIKNGIYTDSSSQIILKNLFSLRKELLEKRPYYEIKLDNLVSNLMIDFARINNNIPESHERSLSHIEGFLRENFIQDIDYYTLAELSGYSYDRFRHIFKKVYGVSPHQYTLQLRLQHACRLLEETDYKITHIALESGFCNGSQFCSFFHKIYGYTPVKYREKQRNSQHIS